MPRPAKKIKKHNPAATNKPRDSTSERKRGEGSQKLNPMSEYAARSGRLIDSNHEGHSSWYAEHWLEGFWQHIFSC